MALGLGWGFVKKFTRGVILASKGIIQTSRSPQTLRALRPFSLQLAVIFMIFYLVLVICLYACYITLGIIDIFLPSQYELYPRMPSTWSVACTVSSIVSPLTFLALNLTLYARLEELFFAQLWAIEPQMQTSLQKLTAQGMKAYLEYAIRRQTLYAGIGIMLFVAGLLPNVFGVSLRSVFQVLLGMWICLQVIGYPFIAIPFALSRLIPNEWWEYTGIPIRNYHILACWQVLLCARSVSRQLVEPYLRRTLEALAKEAEESMKTVPLPSQQPPSLGVHAPPSSNPSSVRSSHRASVGTKTKPKQKPYLMTFDGKVWFPEHGMNFADSSFEGYILSKIRPRENSLLLGFSLPFALMMSIPIIGPLFVPFSQACGSYLVAVLMKEKKRVLTSKEKSILKKAL